MAGIATRSEGAREIGGVTVAAIVFLQLHVVAVNLGRRVAGRVKPVCCSGSARPAGSARPSYSAGSAGSADAAGSARSAGSAYSGCSAYTACSTAARLPAISRRASIRLTHASPFGSATGKRQQATSRDEQRSKPTGRAAHGLTPKNASKEDTSGATLNDSPVSCAVFAKILRLQVIRRIPSVQPFDLGLDLGP